MPDKLYLVESGGHVELVVFDAVEECINLIRLTAATIKRGNLDNNWKNAGWQR